MKILHRKCGPGSGLPCMWCWQELNRSVPLIHRMIFSLGKVNKCTINQDKTAHIWEGFTPPVGSRRDHSLLLSHAGSFNQPPVTSLDLQCCPNPLCVMRKNLLSNCMRRQSRKIYQLFNILPHPLPIHIFLVKRKRSEHFAAISNTCVLWFTLYSRSSLILYTENGFPAKRQKSSWKNRRWIMMLHKLLPCLFLLLGTVLTWK